MKELIITLNENDFFLYGMLCGIAFSTFFNIIISLINFFDERKGLIKDYEKIIYLYTALGSAQDNKEFEIISNAKISHKERLEKRERLDKFLSNFRRKKDV